MPPAGSWPASTGAAAQVFVGDLETPVLLDDDAHHLLRVRRLRPGEVVVAADGTGRWRRCVVAGQAAGDALRPDGEVVMCPAPPYPVTVGFVPVKGDRPEWVVQKLTEAGVDRIVVLDAARAVVRWSGERQDRNLQRLRRVAHHAAAQSRRPRVPDVCGVWSLRQADSAVGAAATPGQTPLAQTPLAQMTLADPGARLPAGLLRSMAVGPEGGWTDDELAGRPTASLGPAVLRAETAAVFAAVVLVAWRDGVAGPPPVPSA